MESGLHLFLLLLMAAYFAAALWLRLCANYYRIAVFWPYLLGAVCVQQKYQSVKKFSLL
jgi:hypothetical protein